MTKTPQATGLVALADRIELWPIQRLRPYERQVDQIAASMLALADGEGKPDGAEEGPRAAGRTCQ